MKLHINKKPRAFLDLETTGLDPAQHEILEFAFIIEDHDGMPPSASTLEKLDILKRLGVAVECGEGRICLHAKIKPQHIETAEPKALEINGYTEEGWKGALDWGPLTTPLHSILKHCVCIGHNIDFDLGFLQAGFRGAGVKGWMDYHKIDTCALAYEHLVGCGLANLKLFTICTFLGISNEGAHGALPDTKRVREVFYKLYRAGWWKRVCWRWHAPIQG